MSESEANWRDRATEEVQQAVETIADASGEEPDDMVGRFEQMYGPIEDLPDEFAQEFNERAEKDVRQAMSWAANNAPGDMGNSQGSSESGSSTDDSAPEATEGPSEPAGEVSRSEFNELQRSVRQTNSQLQELTNALEGVASGGGGGGGGEDGGQNQLAAILAQQFLGGGQEANPMGEFGNMLAQEAMKGWVRDMQKPGLGDMIEMQMYKDMAPELAEKYEQDLFGEMDMPDGVEGMMGGDDDGDDD